MIHRYLVPKAPHAMEAKAALLRCRPELGLLNESAAQSLDTGLEETLTLHQLGLFRELRISLQTQQRWLAATLLDIEPRLRRIKGFRALPRLRQPCSPTSKVACED